MPQRCIVTRFPGLTFNTENQQSDYTVCVTGDQDEHNNIYIADVFRFAATTATRTSALRSTRSSLWGPDFLGVEDGQIREVDQEPGSSTRCAERQVFQAYEVLQPSGRTRLCAPARCAGACS